MEKIGNITTKMVGGLGNDPSPQIGFYEAKQRWIKEAKRYLLKTEKNSFLKGATYAKLPHVQRCIDNSIKFDLVLQSNIDFIEMNGELKSIFIAKLVHIPTGQTEVSRVPILLAKNDPQAFSSAMTYYRRIVGATMLDVVTVDMEMEKDFAEYLFDDDDDANEASNNEDTSKKTKSSKSGSSNLLNKDGDPDPLSFDELKKQINNSDLDQLQKLWTKHKPEDDKVIQLFSDRKKALTERK